MIEILLLCDSRGYALERQTQKLLSSETLIRIHVLATPGGTINDVVNTALATMTGKRFHQIYLTAGVNDMTCKLGYREVTPIFNNWSILVRYMMIQFYEARSSLYALSNTVTVCELVGLHLGLYNSSGLRYQPQQDILNRGVIRINEYIANMNRQANVYSPYFAGLTHKMKGTDNIYHRYALTTYDGLHFNQVTAHRMAEYLIQNITDLYLDTVCVLK